MKKNQFKYRSCSQISADIEIALEYKGLTLSECVEAFDSRYDAEIAKGKKLPMNKDFISRAKNGGFKVVSRRVLDLCELLDVNPYETDKKMINMDQVEVPFGQLKKEFENVEKIVRKRPDLEKKVKIILRSIADIVSVQGV
ncbi:hypothetical protein MSP8886_02730 [Marinomonas spartinae]|uniref:Uncharacterized protein n=1 Tax=Marinomonas spartinae TaxID=1792290 RepID=A0A1A8TIY2_9GAMM|nr:hypothetical protein [Marinomonas spartinae]SBS33363.1 hypothetical protein MSP8886_02730 [Marinomonas spartinae]